MNIEVEKVVDLVLMLLGKLFVILLESDKDNGVLGLELV